MLSSAPVPGAREPAALVSMSALVMLGMLVLCVVLPMRWLFGHRWPRLRQALFFPLAGQMRWEHRTQRQRLLKRLGGEEVALTTADDRVVHGVWAQPKSYGVGAHPEGGGPVALLLHANAMVLDDMSDWAQFYLSLGVAVFVLTFWGYPDPAEGYAEFEPDGTPVPTEGRYCPDELTLYLDAEAAFKHVHQARRVPAERVLAHGVSLGGAAACALGVAHDGLKVTADQTFVSMLAVSTHVGRGLYDQVVLQRAPRWCRAALRLAAPCLVRCFAWLAVRMSFNSSRAEAAAYGCCAPDGLDNVRKAARIRGEFFVFLAEHDEMMPADFGRRLVHARYGRRAPELRDRVLCIPGGHCSFFGDVPELRERYRQYLAQIGYTQ